MDSESIANRVQARRASRMSVADGTQLVATQVPSTPSAENQALPIFTNPRTGLPLVPRPAASGRKRRAAELGDNDDEDVAHTATLAEARRGKRICRDPVPADLVPAAACVPSLPQNPVVPAVVDKRMMTVLREPRFPARISKKQKRKRNLQIRDPVLPSLQRPLPKTTLLYHHFVCRRGSAEPYGIDHLTPGDGAAVRAAEALFTFRRRCPEAAMPTPAEITAWLATNRNDFRVHRTAAATPSSRPRHRPRRRRPQLPAAEPEALGFLHRAVQAGRRVLEQVFVPTASPRLLHRAPDAVVWAAPPPAADAAATEPSPALRRPAHHIQPRPPPSNGPSLPSPWRTSPGPNPVDPQRRTAGVQGDGGRFYVPEFSDSESDG